jgi:hypothetical protein
MVSRLAAIWWALAIGVTSVGCEPNLDQRTFAVTSARVLAVRADPAEVAPGTNVTLTTLYVGPSGPITTGPFDWAYCDARNPLANLGPVSPDCYARTGSAFVELGAASSERSPLPVDACSLFGPDVPATTADAAPGRPVDPDPTGGYYQPVRLAVGDQIAIGMARILCGIPGASPDQLTVLASESHPNRNPQIDEVSDSTLGTLSLAGSGTNTVHLSQRLDLRASWAVCDPTAVSCTGSEGYAYLDPETHIVVQAREEIRVSWFATGGTFDDDRTGRDASDPTPYTSDGWSAPTTTGPVYIWLVIRDDRGGSGWRSYVVDVQ